MQQPATGPSPFILASAVAPGEGAIDHVPAGQEPPARPAADATACIR